ncbi:MAG: hypothetical protein QOF85_2053 [Solirubrobacterales bacterium]|nr:hypothetical protein [Solirubrobacterales bacterium]
MRWSGPQHGLQTQRRRGSRCTSLEAAVVPSANGCPRQPRSRLEARVAKLGGLLGAASSADRRTELGTDRAGANRPHRFDRPRKRRHRARSRGPRGLYLSAHGFPIPASSERRNTGFGECVLSTLVLRPRHRVSMVQMERDGSNSRDAEGKKPGREPGDLSKDPHPHKVLGNPVEDPDPTEWPDPYEKRKDPRDPPDPDGRPFGEQPHPPTGSTSTSEPHPSQDPEAGDRWEGPKRDKLDD